MDLGKALRALQVLLVLAAVLTGLSWFEGTGDRQHREIAEEVLDVRTEAAVETPRGPWKPGMAFTQDHAGVPLGVAPTMNVTATHGGQGFTASDHGWSAIVSYEATGDGGETWWRTTEPVAIDPSGANASLALDLPRTIQEARVLADATEVPSRLTLSVEVRHEATVTIDGEPRSTEHTAVVDLVPREGFVVVDTHDDGSTYSQPVEEERDWMPLALLAPAVLAEGGLRLHRRGDPPWMHQRGVEAVEVSHLGRPTRGHRTSFPTLLRLARNRDRPLLVDEQAHMALVDGDPPLWATTPTEEGGEDASDR